MFEINGISCVHSDLKNPYNYLLAGDKFGNLLLLDMNKKIQLHKKEVVKGKRIIHIDSITINTPDGHICTISVIIKGDPNVYIYRLKY